MKHVAFPLMSRLITALCLFISAQAFAQYTVETVPNQRELTGSMVTNPDGILTSSGVATLGALLADIETTTTAQVAVVAIESIGEADLFDFAQELFNTWGIGQKNNNGVLVLLVTDQRTIRIHTGLGVEGILTDVTCKRIQRDYMVPSFKEGDYEAGMIAGVQRIHEILNDPSKAEELTYVDEGGAQVSSYAGWMIFYTMFYGIPFLILWAIKALGDGFVNSKKRSKGLYDAMELTQRAWVIEFGLIPLLIAASFWPGEPEDAIGLALGTLYVYFAGTQVYRLVRERRVLKQFIDEEKYYEATIFIGSTTWRWFGMAVLFPFPFVLYFIFHLTRRSHYRNHARKCELCQAQMNKLNEKDDDKYLDEKQRFEETIKSLDYDVWLCPSCNASREWQYPRKEKYMPCPSCKTKAYYSASRRTVVSPTYTSSGSGEEVHECKFCHVKNTSRYSIAKRVASSSSSGGSRSSGSSFGGGRSGGGGSSSSW